MQTDNYSKRYVKPEQYKAHSVRTRSVPIYPVILFVIAFLYLLGVMFWQFWRDYDYHQMLTSKMVQSKAVLYQEYFRSQVAPIDKLLVEKYRHSFSDPDTLDDFYLDLTSASPLTLSAALVDTSGVVITDVGVPLTRKTGASEDVLFDLNNRSSVSGFSMLNEQSAYVFHRRPAGQGFLVAVIEFEWFKALLTKSHYPYASFELLDTRGGDHIWEDALIYLPDEDKLRVWSLYLPGSELELTGYINLKETNRYYHDAATPSALVAFFYLFGGVGLIWYLSSARKQNKRLLKKNRDLAFRGDLILSSISDAVVVVGEEGRFYFANAAFFSLLKLNSDQSIDDVVQHHGKWPIWGRLRNWSGALLSGQAVEVESTFSIDELAVTRHVEPSHQLLSLEDDTQVVVWVLKDVTEQHRIHEQLITSQSHYQSTFEGAGVPLTMIDLNELGELLSSGAITSKEEFTRWRDKNAWQFRSMIDGVVVTEINESACRMLDTIDSMTAARHIKTALFYPDSVIWNAILELVTLDNEKAETLIDLQSATGKVISAHLNLSFVKPNTDQSKAGQLTKGHLLLSLLDVTALKVAKEKAAEREQFWQKVVNSVPDIVYVNDFSTHENVFSNHEIGLRLGYSWSEIEALGERYWQKFLHPEDLLILKSELPKFREIENGKVKETVLRLKHKNGKWRNYLFRDTPFIRDEDNKVKRYIGVARDITELLAARTRVDKHERYLEVLAENIRDLVWVMDPEFRFKYISPSIAQVLGYKQEDILHQGARAFLAEDQFARIETEIAGPLKQVMLGNVDAETYRNTIGEHVVDVMALHQDGHYVSLEVKIGLLWDEDNNFEGLLGSCRDVTRRRKSQAELRLAAEVFENSSEAILITDMDGDIVRTNKAFQSITAYDLDELTGQNISVLCTEQQTERFYSSVFSSADRLGYWQGEVWHRKKTGEPFPAWVGVSAIRNEDDFVESYIVIFSDMSERKEAEERIHHLAYYDPLTDLANRSLFMEQLRLEMRHADDCNGAVALLYLDLDNFKPVNDTLGHEAGDQLLKEVALRLSSCVRSSDTVARMGGDEFTIILGNHSDLAQARRYGEHVAAQVVSALHEPVTIQSQEFSVTASVGVAIYPEHGSDVSELLRHADQAMYRAKEKGRNAYCFYIPE